MSNGGCRWTTKNKNIFRSSWALSWSYLVLPRCYFGTGTARPLEKGPVSIAKSQIEGGSVKALAILTKDRSPIMPKLASAHEQGLTNFEAGIWYAIFLPKGTPGPIVQKLHEATVATLNSSAVQDRLQVIGTTVV